MKNQLKLTAGAAALLMSVGAHAGTIDLFTTAQTLEQATVGSTSSQVGSAGDTSIIGGYRDAYLEMVSTAGFPGAVTSLDIGTGYLVFSNDSGVNGLAQIMWNGNNPVGYIDPLGSGGTMTIGGAPALNMDLTLGGTVAQFNIVTYFSDLGWTFDVTAYTDSTHWTTVRFDAGATNVQITEAIPFFAFDTLAVCGGSDPAHSIVSITCGSGGTADMTNLDALFTTLNTSGTTAVDLTLGPITTVPEPGILGLVGIGLVGLGFVGRARRKVA